MTDKTDHEMIAETHDNVLTLTADYKHTKQAVEDHQKTLHGIAGSLVPGLAKLVWGMAIIFGVAGTVGTAVITHAAIVAFCGH